MRLKWILGIAAILVIALIVTVIAILSSYDFNKFKPMITQRVRNATGRDLTLGGDIDLKIGFTPTLVVEDVSFQNAQWGSRPELAKVRRLEVQVALLPLIGRNIEVKRLVLVEPDILIETDNLGKSNVDFRPTKRPEDKKTEKAEALPVLGLREVSMENGRFTYKDGRSKKVHSIALKRLDAISEGLDSPLEMELRGTYNDNPFELTGTFGPFYKLVASDKAWPLNFTLNIADTTVSVHGTMTDATTPKGISLSIDMEGRSVVDIAKLAKVKDLPDIGPFKVGLKVSNPQPKTYKISELKLSLENNDLSGSAQISLINKRPELIASVSSTSLDLRPILSKEKSSAESKGTAEQPEQKRDKVFPNDPLPLDGLNYADAKVQFQADQIMLPRLALHDLTFNLVHCIVNSAFAIGNTRYPYCFIISYDNENKPFNNTMLT